MRTNIVIPVNPKSLNTTLEILETLNEIDNISITLISLKDFFESDKISNDFISNLINKAKSKHSISQIWMDEIFNSYNIFPSICKENVDIYKYFDIVKIFIPYIKELMWFEKVIFLNEKFSINNLNTIVNLEFNDIAVQAYVLKSDKDIITTINNDFALHGYPKVTWNNFKSATDIPGNTNVVVYNSKHFNKIFAENTIDTNKNTFQSIINLQRFIEFTDYMDALISLCYNYKTFELVSDIEEESPQPDQENSNVEETETISPSEELNPEPEEVIEEPPQLKKKSTKSKMKK